MNTDPIVRIKDARQELGVSNTTIYRWQRLGLLHVVKIGPRASGIRRSELERVKNGGNS